MITTTVQFNPINAFFPENLAPLFPLQNSAKSGQISAKFHYYRLPWKTKLSILVFQFLPHFCRFSTNPQGGAR
jgi:hypothetical protein